MILDFLVFGTGIFMFFAFLGLLEHIFDRSGKED